MLMKNPFKIDLFPKKKKPVTQEPVLTPEDVLEEERARERADNFEHIKQIYFTELLTPVPGLQNMPMSWCRNYLLDRVGSNIRSQAFKVISIILILVVMSISITAVAYSLYELSNNQINNRLAETKEALELYSNEIKSAMDLNGILDYVSDISVEDQMKGIMKITIESGIITHGIRFGKNIADIPNNVKNNFETASAV
ncbi:MAG: hypothetical protein EOM59_19060, partial [Clostridia bacterium]|nr:hypothetical protein [Clostridia bacterium]